VKRKLTAIEHMIDGNIVYVATVEGNFTPDRLRFALRQVQRKHPALRSVIREECDGLYYEEDCAPEISLRVLPRITERDSQRECQAELAIPFAYGQPQLRIVLLRAEQESDVLFVSSHRICDGMSMLTIVREVLRLLYTDEDLVPYEAVTTRDMIGDYEPAQPWKRKLTAHLLNGVLRLVPVSHRKPENKEYYLEWSLDRFQTEALKQRCKAEGTSIHAALLVALGRSLFSVLGKKKLPAWIESPMDARRGRLARLKSDMLFFGGGSLKIHTEGCLEKEFWTTAREINEEIRRKIEQELLDIPSRYYFNELLRPVPNGRIQTMVRIGDLLKVNGSWNRFALSNLGNVAVSDDESPFRLKDLRLYVHSFNFRLLGLVIYTLHGEMRFYYAGDENCLGRDQADALRQEFTKLLKQQTGETADERGFHYALSGTSG
jgi:hypothetical protein